ncbi:MAG: type I restriction enzyme HsdR N-terminal domain-containing protein, partial [Muribaculaceae bacterium]|nr:type I restriction enzyme HsdR N-terminal domain-containing protein [Muribaculaceae bacterium]
MNLPPAQLQLRRSDKGDIVVFDPLRKKNVILTPEEWVRQNFVSYMTNQLGYPQSLMA